MQLFSKTKYIDVALHELRFRDNTKYEYKIIVDNSTIVPEAVIVEYLENQILAKLIQNHSQVFTHQNPTKLISDLIAFQKTYAGEYAIITSSRVAADILSHKQYTTFLEQEQLLTGHQAMLASHLTALNTHPPIFTSDLLVQQSCIHVLPVSRVFGKLYKNFRHIEVTLNI